MYIVKNKELQGKVTIIQFLYSKLKLNFISTWLKLHKQVDSSLSKQVDSSLSKNQALISLTTVITIINKYTMTSKKSHVNRDSLLRNA